MKPINKLIFSILLWLGIASCATSPRESAVSDSSEEATVMSGELEAQFTADHLSAEHQDALEVRAQQKLLDFADYITLISNPNIDSTFRQQANEQTRQLFIHPQTMISLDEENIIIEEFLDKVRLSGKNQQYIVQNIEIAQPLRQESAQQYSGELTFSQQSVVDGQGNTHQHQAEIWVKKVDKKFGKEEKKVWEVFLGNIK